MGSVQLAKNVLAENARVLYGFFGIVESSGLFPPMNFLNEFLMIGSDPCDQDGRMSGWAPFELSPDEYHELKAWWISWHSGAVEDQLGVQSWSDWQQEILDR